MSGKPQKQPQRAFDMSKVQAKLDRLLLALGNKLQREQSTRAAGFPTPVRPFLLVNVELARSTFRAICYMCADKRLKEHDWRWDYTLILPPLNRTILDSVFNVVFMLEDVTARSNWYHESGFREAIRELERHKSLYAGLPEWKEWFQKYEEMLQRGSTQFGICLTKLRANTKYKWWPNPGKMASETKSPETRDFLEYLNDWFYRELSSQAHLGFAGVMKSGSLILRRHLDRDKQEETESRQFPFFRGHQICRTVTLLLCLVSEIEHGFAFELHERLLELWHLVIESVPEAKEVFDKRYSRFWPHGVVSGRK